MSLTLPSSRTPDPMSAPPLRWGVIGTGWIASMLVETLHANTRQRLVAVGSRTKERAEAFASRYGAERSYGSYEELVADPGVDVVYVATPHSEHLANALLAISAGKHLLVEKAFTRNAGEARQVFDAARTAGVSVLEAMWTRFLPDMDILRQLLADGALGELETVFADHGQWFAHDPEFRLYDPLKAGGAMLDLGVYPVSFTHFVLGAPGRAVARGTRAFTGVDRQISAVLDEYPSHPNAHALVSTTLAAKTPTVGLVSGELARVEVPGAFYSPQRIRLISRDGEAVESDEPTLQGHLGLCYEAVHLATMIDEGRQESELLTWADTLAVMETMDELRRQVGITLPGEEL
ncbi:MAG: Gfo/Idh/MocA family oxidoreductase [Arachnia sp.]